MPLDGELMIETAEVMEPLLSNVIKLPNGNVIPVRYKGAFGGRGGTKSHFFAELMIEECVIYPAQRNVCLRETQKSLKFSSKQLLDDKISKLDVHTRFNSLKTHIDVRDGAGCSTGGVIIFEGMQNHTAHSIKSLEGFDRAWFEEAQTCSQTSLDMLRPTLRKPGSQIWFGWNPNDAKDPVDKFLRQQRPDNAIVVECSYKHNPWFPDVLREDMEYDKRRDPDRYEHIWLGRYRKNSGARVFNNWRVGDPAEFKSHSGIRFYFGCDFGFSVDPSVLIRMYIEGRTLYIDREAYAVGCEIDYTPFLFAGINDQEMRKKNASAWNSLSSKTPIPDWAGIPGATKWPITADSARPESISYLKRHGFDKIKAAKKGANSVEEGVEFLKSYDIVIHPQCVHTIDEFTMYSWKVDPLTQDVLPELNDKKNHVIDAARYGVEPLRRGTMGVF